MKAGIVRIGIAFSLSILGSSCSPDRKQADMDRCLSVAKTENTSDAGESKEETHDAIGATIVDCMKHAGYRHDLADGRCIDDVDFNSYCYVHRR
jgi:hypothetical protein